MYKRITMSLLTAFVLIIGTSAAWTVQSAGSGGSDPVVATVDEHAGKKGGNGFVRALKAPFKAIGRLFGGGKKDENKLERLSEKDVKRFETAPLVRTTDALNPAAPAVEHDDTLEGIISEGRAALAQKRINDAIVLLSRAVSLGPERWEAHHLLGVAYFRKGFPEQSRLSFERAVHFGGRNAEVLNDYGYALHRFGDNKSAAKQLKRAVKLAPGNSRVWNNLALAQCRLGDFDDAYKSFTRSGGEFYGRMNTATQLERAGRDAEAARHYEAARLLNPNARDVLLNLANAYQRLGRAAEAAQVTRELNGAMTEKPLQARGN